MGAFSKLEITALLVLIDVFCIGILKDWRDRYPASHFSSVARCDA